MSTCCDTKSSARFSLFIHILTLLAFLVSGIYFYFVTHVAVNSCFNEVDKKTAVLQTQIDDLKKVNEELSKKVASMPSTVNADHDKLLLLATMHNENLRALQLGKPNHIIFINGNWTIDRMPRYLDMGKDEMQWIIQFVDKENAMSRTQSSVEMPKVPTR